MMRNIMIKKRKRVPSAFEIVNAIFLSLAALLCVIPFLNTLSISFSSSVAVNTGRVFIWPVDFDLMAYKFVIQRQQFWTSALISVKRVVLGLVINTFILLISAYPLSKEKGQFKARTIFVWYFFITSIFSGGLIPLYIMVVETNLLNSIWALVLPGSVAVGNIILLLNFFRQLPRELDDAAFIDGAGHWRLLFQIYVPLSKAALATMILFEFVAHWNSWFDGMIYMTMQDKYPLQTFIRNVTIKVDLMTLSPEEQEIYLKMSDRTMRCAQVFLAALPIMVIYPFLQRFFVKGLVLGSVKG